MVSFAKKCLFLFSLLMPFAPAYAGGVLNVFRINLPNKTVYGFGEVHDGSQVKEIAQSQYLPLHKIFKDLISIDSGNAKNVLYLEAQDDYCSHLKEHQIQEQNGGIFYNPPSFFDAYISLFAHGIRMSPEFSSIKNFDDRSELDSRFLMLAAEFDEFLEHYKQSDFNEYFFDKAKAHFLKSETCRVFADEFDEWMQTFSMRIEQKAALIKNLLPESDASVVDALINSYSAHFHLLQRIEMSAAHMKKTIFELLFDLEHAKRGNLINALKNIFYADDRVESIFSIFDCCNLIADLDLLYNILSDEHSTIVCYGGNKHLQNIYTFFQLSRLTQFASQLDMLDDQMLEDQEYYYQQLRDFMFGHDAIII